MKKLTTFICSCLAFLLISQSTSFAYASNKTNVTTNKNDSSYKSAFMTDDNLVPITDENLINELKLLDPGMKKEASNTNPIQPYSYPSDNPDSRMITGKVRQAYSNTTIKAVVIGLYNYIATKVPEVAKKNAIYYAINSFVSLKINSSLQPHYFEAWLWETHDWNNGVHIVYTTTIHYTDSSYSKVDGVDYYQVDYYPIYKNGVHYHKY